MFDFSFGELLLLAVVALIVLGPERLPKVARLAGLWARKARAQWNAVKAELENEIADEELRRNLREASAAMRETVQRVHALPEALRNDPTSADAATAMTALDPMRSASQQDAANPSAPTPVSQDAPDHSTVADAPIEPDHDPAQMGLLDEDSVVQMSLLPPAAKPHSDG